MATKLSSTRLGLITPGWSVESQATPNVIGTPSSSTGVARFSAVTVTDTEFVLNDTNTLTREGVGLVTGPVDGVQMRNLNSTASQGTVLTQLNVDAPKGAWLGGTKQLSLHFRDAIAAVAPTVTVTWLSATNPTKTYPYWRGNIWKSLNDMCSATGREIYIDDNVILIHDVGGRSSELTEWVAGSSPTISIDSSASAYSIEVTNMNTTAVTNGELYNALTDDNAMYEVGARDTVTYSVVTDCYPRTLNQPSAVTKVWPNQTVSPGTYAVSASDGRAIPADIWRAFKGKVTVAISDQAANMIDITLHGPQWLIPSYEAPYRLSVSDSVNDTATLSIAGTGTRARPETLILYTGAAPGSVTGNAATRIENMFLNDYDTTCSRGAWAIDEAQGPNVTLRATIPIGPTVTGLATTVGSTFLYGEQRWRITSSTIGNTTLTISATRHTTAGEVDALWAGSTAGEYAAFWAGHPAEDATIKPLRK